MAITRYHGDQRAYLRAAHEAGKAEKRARQEAQEQMSLEAELNRATALQKEQMRSDSTFAIEDFRQQNRMELATQKHKQGMELARERGDILNQNEERRLKRQKDLREFVYNLQTTDAETQQSQAAEFIGQIPLLLEEFGINDETDPDGRVRNQIRGYGVMVDRNPAYAKYVMPHLAKLLDMHMTGSESRQQREAKAQLEMARVERQQRQEERQRLQAASQALGVAISNLRAQRSAIYKRLEEMIKGDEKSALRDELAEINKQIGPLIAKQLELTMSLVELGEPETEPEPTEEPADPTEEPEEPIDETVDEQPMDMPKSKDELEVGKVYRNKHGVLLRWTGEGFEVVE
jgi:hypothetical protein